MRFILLLILINIVNCCQNKLYNNNKYIYCNDLQTYNNANTYCIENKGNLLLIDDINKDYMIYNMISYNIWLGISNNTALCPYLENNNIMYSNDCNVLYEFICKINIPNSSAMILTNSDDTSNYIPIYIGLIAPITSLILIINIIIKIKEFKKFKKSLNIQINNNIELEPIT